MQFISKKEEKKKDFNHFILIQDFLCRIHILPEFCLQPW